MSDDNVEIEYEYAIVHVPSGKTWVTRYKNKGTALNRLEDQVRKHSDETLKYLQDCVVRKYKIEKRTTHEDISLSDVYDFAPDKPEYVKRHYEEECPQCLGTPPPGFQCKTCKDEGVVKVPKAKATSVKGFVREHRKGYKTIPKRMKVGEKLYRTPEEVEEG